MQNMQKTERAHTPATVAEPDSTMSVEAGDQTMPADVEPAESSGSYGTGRRNGTEAVGHWVLEDDARNDTTNYSCDADNSRVNFRGRYSWEKPSDLDAASTRRRTGMMTKFDAKLHGYTRHVEPSTSGSAKISEESEPASLRPSGIPSRKRECRDVEVNAGQSVGNVNVPSFAVQTSYQPPPDIVRKKHRPDPLVLAPSSVEHYGYPSWLRSPRVWNGTGAVPYTPPPMLSPARRAPGLFWATARAQNLPFWSLFRQQSAFSCEFLCIFL